MNYANPKAAAIFVIGSVISMAGCTATGTTPRIAMGGDETVEICETRGTHTQCFKQNAGAYVAEREMYREFLEMREEFDE